MKVCAHDLAVHIPSTDRGTDRGSVGGRYADCQKEREMCVCVCVCVRGGGGGGGGGGTGISTIKKLNFLRRVHERGYGRFSWVLAQSIILVKIDTNLSSDH